jgi:hypothetical protein
VKRARALFAASLATSIAGGCTYLHQRARDAADVFTASGEVGGYGASLQVGPLRAPSLYFGAGEGAGLVGGQFTSYAFEQYDALVVAQTWLGEFDDDTRAKESRLAHYACVVGVPTRSRALFEQHPPTDREFDYNSPKRWGPRLGQIEVAAGLGGGVRLGVNLVEAVDFVVGWFGLDILGDDPPWFPPDWPKLIPEEIPSRRELARLPSDPSRSECPLAKRFPGAFGTGWFSVRMGERKVGVVARSLSHDRDAHRIVEQVEFSAFPDTEGRFYASTSERRSFLDDAPYELSSRDAREQVNGRQHFTHDEWDAAGGHRKQLVAGVFRERKLHSVRPRLTIIGSVSLETALESLDVGFRGEAEDGDDEELRHVEVVERVLPEVDDPRSGQIKIREWRERFAPERSTYRSDGALLAFTRGSMEWSASSVEDAFTFPVAADVETLRYVELEGAGEWHPVFGEVEFEWPAGPDLLPCTDTQASRWIEKGKVQRVVTRCATEPTPEERAAPVDPVAFAQYLRRTDDFDFDDPIVRGISNRRASGLDPWEKVEICALHVMWHAGHGPSKHFSASDVERFRGGDCTSRARLLVALLRLDGVPARVVDGLVRDPGAPRLGMHRWVEAWVGRWISIDPDPFFTTVADAYHLRTSVEDDTDTLPNIPWGRKVRVIREVAR